MKYLFLLALLSGSAYAGSSGGGGGGLAITLEPTATGKDGSQYELSKEDFAKVVATLLAEKPVVVNDAEMTADRLEFKSRSILLRSSSDKSQIVVLKEMPAPKVEIEE